MEPLPSAMMPGGDVDATLQRYLKVRTETTADACSCVRCCSIQIYIRRDHDTRISRHKDPGTPHHARLHMISSLQFKDVHCSCASTIDQLTADDVQLM